MTKNRFHDYIMSFDNVQIEYPYTETTALYKVKYNDTEKIVAIIEEASNPLKISLRCDPQLAKHLRDKYEEVQPGVNLNEKYWNTILNTGQLDDSDIKDLIRLSYDLSTTQ